MSEKLYQIWMESDDDFFNRVEACGGWPMDKKFVTMAHTVESKRPCEFTDRYLRTEWWTTLYSRDDYLWWKLSAERKEEEAKKVREAFATTIRRMA